MSNKENIEISKDGAGRITQISFNKPAAIKVTAWKEILRNQINNSSLREIGVKKDQSSVKFPTGILTKVRDFSEDNKQRFLDNVSKTLFKADQVIIADVSPKSPFISIKNPDNAESEQILNCQKKNGGTDVFLTLKEDKEDDKAIAAQFDPEDSTIVALFDDEPLKLEKYRQIGEIIIMGNES